MNPFRKKSPASSSSEVPAPAPVAEPLDPRVVAAVLTDTGVPVDIWTGSPISPLRASPTSSPPPSIKTPKSPPPVAPRRRRSQIGPRKRTPPPAALPPPAAPPPPSDPFNPTPVASSDSETEPRGDSSTRSLSPANPFLRTGDPRLDPTSEKPARQSLDAEAFKRLMLTGFSSPPPADSNSTDSSSVSRHSLFEPIPESGTETPRTSSDTERTKDRGTRPKPPPPKPRSRGGGKSPISPSQSSSSPPPPPPPPPGRPASVYSLDKPLLPLLQTTVLGTGLAPSSPPSPAPSLQKRLAPEPPLSRRHSVKGVRELERPGTPGKMKPPLPPIRRMKSVNARPAGHGRAQSLGVVTMLPPPPPPPPRSRAASVEEEGVDILVDLQKLQREVDELRGKYEGRVGVGVEGGVGV